MSICAYLKISLLDVNFHFLIMCVGRSGLLLVNHESWHYLCHGLRSRRLMWQPRPLSGKGGILGFHVFLFWSRSMKNGSERKSPYRLERRRSPGWTRITLVRPNSGAQWKVSWQVRRQDINCLQTLTCLKYVIDQPSKSCEKYSSDDQLYRVHSEFLLPYLFLSCER